MLVARIPLSKYLYRHCHDDLTDQDMGFLTSLKVVPSRVKGTWTPKAKGRCLGEEVVQCCEQDQMHLLRITDEKVSVSELALELYRARCTVSLFRELLGEDQVLERAARIALAKEYRMVGKVMSANGTDDFHWHLLQTEFFLLSVAPIRTKAEE